MPQRRECRGEMLGALSTYVPIHHRQEDNVTVPSVLCFDPNEESPTVAEGKSPAIPEVVGAVLFSSNGSRSHSDSRGARVPSIKQPA